METRQSTATLIPPTAPKLSTETPSPIATSVPTDASTPTQGVAPETDEWQDPRLTISNPESLAEVPDITFFLTEQFSNWAFQTLTEGKFRAIPKAAVLPPRLVQGYITNQRMIDDFGWTSWLDLPLTITKQTYAKQGTRFWRDVASWRSTLADQEVIVTLSETRNDSAETPYGLYLDISLLNTTYSSPAKIQDTFRGFFVSGKYFPNKERCLESWTIDGARVLDEEAADGICEWLFDSEHLIYTQPTEMMTQWAETLILDNKVTVDGETIVVIPIFLTSATQVSAR